MLVLLPDDIGGHSAKQRIILKTVIASFIVNLYLNLSFYPSLMHYQAGSEAAMWINNHNPRNLPVVEYNNDYVEAFEFYSDKQVTAIDGSGKGKLPPGPFLFYAPAGIITSLHAKGWKMQTQSTFERYWITRLKPSFLNKNTRDKELTKTEVVLVDPISVKPL